MSVNKNKEKSKRRNRILIIIIAIFTLIVFSLISAVISFAMIYKNSIHNGISIENIDIGGLSVIEANTKIEDNLKYVLDNDKLILKSKDGFWKFDSKDLGLKYDFLKSVNDAYLIGRHGTYLDRVETIIALLKRPYNISLKSKVDIEKINVILNNIEKEVNRPCLNAVIKRENDKFIIKEEKLGLKLNREKTVKKISQSLLNSGFYDIIEIDLITETVTPKHTFEKLSQVKDLLGSYTTKFNTRLKGRSYNVALASKSVDGVVLLPGEIFSFNNVVGPRTKKNGYRTAPIIFKGKLVDGIGGGICQVSSTLYNSALMSGLGIVERTNHTIPSTYVPMGLDATVSYGVLDFKFQNTLDIPLYIESIINGNKITINIYSKKTSNRRIKLTSNIDKVIKKDTEIVFDNNMFEGEELIEDKGRNGYKVSSYMTIYDGGKAIDKKLISKDYYRPRKEIIKKGTKKRTYQKNDEEDNQEEPKKTN